MPTDFVLFQRLRIKAATSTLALCQLLDCVDWVGGGGDGQDEEDEKVPWCYIQQQSRTQRVEKNEEINLVWALGWQNYRLATVAVVCLFVCCSVNSNQTTKIVNIDDVGARGAHSAYISIGHSRTTSPPRADRQHRS